jgi:hypothetical protein
VRGIDAAEFCVDQCRQRAPCLHPDLRSGAILCRRSGVIPIRCPTTKARRASDAGPQVNDLTHGETARYLFAIELSWMSWVIAFNTPLSQKISRRTLIGCKWKRLLKLIEEVLGAYQPRDGSGGRSDLVLRGRL